MFAHDCQSFVKQLKGSTNDYRYSKNSEKVSVQIVNLQKSRIEFSKGIENSPKGEITNILRINTSKTIRTTFGCHDIHNDRNKDASIPWRK